MSFRYLSSVFGPAAMAGLFLLFAGCGGATGPDTVGPLPRFPEEGTLFAFDTYEMSSVGQQLPGIILLTNQRVLSVDQMMFGRTGVVICMDERNGNVMLSSIDETGNPSSYFSDFGLQFGPVGHSFWAPFPVAGETGLKETLFDSSYVKPSGVERRVLVERSVARVGDEMRKVLQEPVETCRFDERLTLTIFDGDVPTFTEIRHWDRWYSPRIHAFVQTDYSMRAGPPDRTIVHDAIRTLLVRYYLPTTFR